MKNVGSLDDFCDLKVNISCGVDSTAQLDDRMRLKVIGAMTVGTGFQFPGTNCSSAIIHISRSGFMDFPIENLHRRPDLQQSIPHSALIIIIY